MRLWRAGHLVRAPVELDRAIARYLDCSADRRELVGALLTLGDFRFQLARYVEAEAAYRRAVDAAGCGPAAVRVDALVRMGHSQRRQGRFDVAEATFRAALLVRSGPVRLRHPTGGNIRWDQFQNPVNAL